MEPVCKIEEISNFRNFKEILNSINDDIAIICRDYSIIFENSHGINIHGSNIRKKCYEVYAKQENVCPDCPSAKVFTNGKEATSEHISYDSDGNEHYVEIVASPLKNQKGEVLASIEVVRDLTERKKAEKEKEELIKELQSALSEIKTLRGVLPICMHCKEIRDDKGYWNQIEEYISKNSDAEFSHSICPECAKKHYPDFDL